MSRLLPVAVLSHCLLLQGFPVVRAPVRPGPAWDTQPKAPEPAGWQEPWAPLPAPILAGPVGFSPRSINLDPPRTWACAVSLKGADLWALPYSQCPGLCFPEGGLLGSLDAAVCIV